MKELKDMNKTELLAVLAATEFFADKTVQKSETEFKAEMKAAEQSAREYAQMRNRQLGCDAAESIDENLEEDDGSADIQNLEGRVRAWLKKTNRLKFYGKK